MNAFQNEFFEQLCDLCNKYHIDSVYVAALDGHRDITKSIVFESNNCKLHVNAIRYYPAHANSKGVFPEQYAVEGVVAVKNMQDRGYLIKKEYNRYDNCDDIEDGTTREE